MGELLEIENSPSNVWKHYCAVNPEACAETKLLASIGGYFPKVAAVLPRGSTSVDEMVTGLRNIMRASKPKIMECEHDLSRKARIIMRLMTRLVDKLTDPAASATAFLRSVGDFQLKVFMMPSIDLTNSDAVITGHVASDDPSSDVVDDVPENGLPLDVPAATAVE